jgi:hypothetical protein
MATGRLAPGRGLEIFDREIELRKEKGVEQWLDDDDNAKKQGEGVGGCGNGNCRMWKTRALVSADV